jgi:hypothetical protein
MIRTASKGAVSHVAQMGSGLLRTTPSRMMAFPIISIIAVDTRSTRIDGQMRYEPAQGHCQQALLMHAGTQLGASDRTFAQVAAARGQGIGVSQHDVAQQLDVVCAFLRPFPYVFLGTLVTIVLARVVAMKPRFDAYAFSTETQRAL